MSLIRALCAVRARFLVPMLAAGSLIGLGGCGFSPLYAEDHGVAPRLAGIQVETGEGREAYLMGQALRDRLGVWEGERQRYLLRTRTALDRTSTSLTIDQVASRIVLRLDVAYGLYDLEGGQLLTQGRVEGQATYDVPSAPYASIRAEQDSVERAAQDAAMRINLVLARYFHQAEAEARQALQAADADYPTSLAQSAGDAPTP